MTTDDATSAAHGARPAAMTIDAATRLAQRWAARGVPAGPMGLKWDPGKGKIAKRPIGRHGIRDYSTDPEVVARLFAGASLRGGEEWGVGLRWGDAGRLVLDLDVGEECDGRDTLSDLEAEFGELPRHPIIRTASGGEHRILPKRPGQKVGNAHSLGPGIDVRSDDGCVVAPGVRCSWGEWTVVDRSETPSHEDVPGWLYERLTDKTAVAGNGQAGPVGHWRQLDRDALDPRDRAALEGLEALGGHSPYIGSDGTVCVTRPGKTSGASATIGYLGPGIVKVFSSNWAPLVAERRYDADQLASMAVRRPGLRAVPNRPDEAPSPRPVDGGAAEARAPETAEEILAALAEHTTWAPIDLRPVAAGILDGTIQTPKPDIGLIDAGPGGLFYRGRVNGLYGKGADGKSWIAIVVCVEQLIFGETVYWVDWEDNEVGITSRLLDLGVPPERLARFRYYRPADPMNLLERSLLVRLAEIEQPAVAVIDSTGEAMAAHGVKPNADEEVARWFQDVARPIADTGAAVIAIDHFPHEADGRLAAIGSTRKYNALSGSAFKAKVLAEFGRDRVGRSALVCAKDRWGHHVRGQVVAEFTLNAAQRPYQVELVPPTPSADAAHPLADEKPAVRRVYDALSGLVDPVTVPGIGDLVAGDGTTGTGLKARTIQDALKRLQELGRAECRGANEAGFKVWTSPSPKPVDNSVNPAHNTPSDNERYAAGYAPGSSAHAAADEDF